MACLNMYKNEQQHHGPYNNNAMSPRISFSNDFSDPPQAMKFENNYREAPVSSDFEFSVLDNSMITADELFFKGKLLPSRENCTRITTLRDELLSGGDDYEDASPRLAKVTSRWKERLGLKKSPKKSDKSIDGALERIDEMKAPEIYCRPALICLDVIQDGSGY